MPKSKRLMEMMMVVNQKRQFTVKELAQEFGISQRTVLRDLQELSELGVPLYSEVGPHGGYRVLKERILPPIAFTEEEAIAIFFATHALRHYTSLPFETESSSALGKFYYYMPEDVRARIDQMKNRVDFVTPMRKTGSPFLAQLLDAAVHQRVIRMDYESRSSRSEREVQPIGIYTKNGFWYCSAYTFMYQSIRLYRCDRILDVLPSSTEPLQSIRSMNLDTRDLEHGAGVEEPKAELHVDLSKEGVERCEAEIWSAPYVRKREDGTGSMEGEVPRSEIPYFAKFFIGLGQDARVQQPQELVDQIRLMLHALVEQYGG
ncbi:helix-turn-helix transcriptional regulator [Paenibacillus guangzhouensis]|uniref:helix-turn-helix transcriptional regulator n=1 Tax=Paenibacillus guangzhouensis TaxID=1473112 RepID=UPI0012670F21|nr:YafY family protein [Paenibacillus guangzhouensis]